MIRHRWPEWWDWDLELSAHILERMLDRNFSEIDLRQMLSDARGYRPDISEGKWVIVTSRRGQAWEVIVRPDNELQRLIVVTAYPYEET